MQGPSWCTKKKLGNGVDRVGNVRGVDNSFSRACKAGWKRKDWVSLFRFPHHHHHGLFVPACSFPSCPDTHTRRGWASSRHAPWLLFLFFLTFEYFIFNRSLLLVRCGFDQFPWSYISGCLLVSLSPLLGETVAAYSLS